MDPIVINTKDESSFGRNPSCSSFDLCNDSFFWRSRNYEYCQGNPIYFVYCDITAEMKKSCPSWLLNVLFCQMEEQMTAGNIIPAHKRETKFGKWELEEESHCWSFRWQILSNDKKIRLQILNELSTINCMMQTSLRWRLKNLVCAI